MCNRLARRIDHLKGCVHFQRAIFSPRYTEITYLEEESSKYTITRNRMWLNIHFPSQNDSSTIIKRGGEREFTESMEKQHRIVSKPSSRWLSIEAPSATDHLSWYANAVGVSPTWSIIARLRLVCHDFPFSNARRNDSIHLTRCYRADLRSLRRGSRIEGTLSKPFITFPAGKGNGWKICCPPKFRSTIPRERFSRDIDSTPPRPSWYSAA